MWPNPQFPAADFVTFTEEILNGKLHFLCNVELYMIQGTRRGISRLPANIKDGDFNNKPWIIFLNDSILDVSGSPVYVTDKD